MTNSFQFNKKNKLSSTPKISKSARDLYKPSNSSKLTFVVMSNNLVDVPKRFTFSKWALAVAFAGVSIAMGASLGMALQFFRMKRQVVDYHRVVRENHTLRSEAVAIAESLELIRTNIEQIESFSEQVRSLTKTQKGRLSFASGPHERGIGPLSREEYKLAMSSRGAQAMGNKDVDTGHLFKELDNLQNRSSQQVADLQELLKDVHEYRERVSVTPTISPVKGWISSLFGWRTSPFTGRDRWHSGLDIAAPLGSPIRAAAAGVVKKVSSAEDYGIFVEIDHGLGILTRYGHAQKITVKQGQRVEKGSQIGLVGMTGRTTGPHVHYELEKNGRKVNPLPYVKVWR